MQKVKRLIICLICFVVLLSSFSVNSSAVYINPYTGEDMLYDEAEDCWYSPQNPLEWEPFAPFINSEPAYDDFDINKLPWLDMPQYVQEILYGSYVGNVNDISYTGEVKLPFVIVIVHSSTIHVIAGWNLFIGSYYPDSEAVQNQTPTSVHISARKENAQIYQNSACYHAMYNPTTYKATSSWSMIEPVTVGDRYVKYHQLNFDTADKDYYCYGFNTFKPGAVTFSQSIYNDKDWYKVYAVNDCVSGFQSGKFVYQPNAWSHTYFGSFTPPTAEQQQAGTSKGIWDTLKDVLTYIKNLPSNIADSIKSFFTSLGDRISGFFDALKTSISGLGDRISGFFDALKSSITGLGDRIDNFFTAQANIIATLLSNLNKSIGGFFTSIGDRISGFFTSIGDRISGFFGDLWTNISDFFTTFKNYVLYFQPTKPEHNNPFSNIFDKFYTFADDYYYYFELFALDIDSAFDNIVSYIESGSGMISQFLNALPIVEAFIFFFVVFCIIRKVVGR